MHAIRAEKESQQVVRMEHNRHFVSTDNKNDEPEVSLRFNPTRRDRSPPIPVPGIAAGRQPPYFQDWLDPHQNCFGHHLQQELGLSASSSPYNSPNSSTMSDWRLSADSGTQFDDADFTPASTSRRHVDQAASTDAEGRRRISTGAESGYYGSPFVPRPGSTLDASSLSVFAFDEDDPDVPSSRRSWPHHRLGVNPSPSPLSMSGLFLHDHQPLLADELDVGLFGQEQEVADSTVAPSRHRMELHAGGSAVFAGEQRLFGLDESSEMSNTFRSIGTQTLPQDFDGYEDAGDGQQVDPHPANDNLFDNSVVAFLAAVPSEPIDIRRQQRLLPVPDDIPVPYQLAGVERHSSANSLTFPLTPAIQAGRCLAYLGKQFDEEHRRQNANQRQSVNQRRVSPTCCNQGAQNPQLSASFPDNNGGFLGFLRNSLRSTRRPRSQSTSSCSFP